MKQEIRHLQSELEKVNVLDAFHLRKYAQRLLDRHDELTPKEMEIFFIDFRNQALELLNPS